MSLVVPEVNVDHFEVIESQPTRKRSGRYLVTNPNCCAIGLVLRLRRCSSALDRKAFCQHHAAVSGAGYPGVASLDILGNVIPYIKNEEESCRKRSATVGSTDGSSFQPLAAPVSAMCNRVAVVDGHTECVSVKLKTPATHAQIIEAWQSFQRSLAAAVFPGKPDCICPPPRFPSSMRRKKHARSRA